jgi:hypothetical protein
MSEDYSLESLMKQREEQLQQENEEDEEVLKEQAIIDDGYLDFDIENGINFRPGSDVVKYFKELSQEDIDRFGDSTEKYYKLKLAHSVYCKSITDQIKQKGLNIDDTYFKQEPNILEKLIDISRFEYLLSLVDLSDSSREAILIREIDKRFSKAVEQPKDNSNIELIDAIKSLNRSIRKKV